MFIVLHMAAGYNVQNSFHIQFFIPEIPHSLSTFNFHFLIQLRNKEIENLFSSQEKITEYYNRGKKVFMKVQKNILCGFKDSTNVTSTLKEEFRQASMVHYFLLRPI